MSTYDNAAGFSLEGVPLPLDFGDFLTCDDDVHDLTMEHSTPSWPSTFEDAIWTHETHTPEDGQAWHNEPDSFEQNFMPELATVLLGPSQELGDVAKDSCEVSPTGLYDEIISCGDQLTKQSSKVTITDVAKTCGLPPCLEEPLPTGFPAHVKSRSQGLATQPIGSAEFERPELTKTKKKKGRRGLCNLCPRRIFIHGKPYWYNPRASIWEEEENGSVQSEFAKANVVVEVRKNLIDVQIYMRRVKTDWEGRCFDGRIVYLSGDQMGRMLTSGSSIEISCSQIRRPR